MVKNLYHLEDGQLDTIMHMYWQEYLKNLNRPLF